MKNLNSLLNRFVEQIYYADDSETTFHELVLFIHTPKEHKLIH